MWVEREVLWRDDISEVCMMRSLLGQCLLLQIVAGKRRRQEEGEFKEY